MSSDAASLVRQVFEGNPLGGADDESRVDDLEYDLGNCMAVDPHPFVPGTPGRQVKIKTREKALLKLATRNMQLLVNKIFDLPTVAGPDGRLVVLPRPSTRLPREKPCPKPKEPTKWEKFAQSKGIQKRKRDRMVFDEQTQEWRPRFGYKSKGELHDWLIPVKDTEDEMTDKYEEKRLMKKQRMLRNQMAQVKNLERASGDKDMPSGVPVQLAGAAQPGRGRNPHKGRGKEAVSKQLKRAQVSTASLGKFDRVVEGEGERKRVKKRRYGDNTDTSGSVDVKVFNKMFGQTLKSRERLGPDELLINAKRKKGNSKAKRDRKGKGKKKFNKRSVNRRR